MKKKLFSKGQMIELEKNPNVLRMTEQAITYHPDFKVKAVLDNIKGEEETEGRFLRLAYSIFANNGYS